MVKKYLTEFEIAQDYETFAQSAAFERPNVSRIISTSGVAFTAPIIDVESIEITNIPYDGQYGQQLAHHQFGISITPENASNKSIYWGVQAEIPEYNEFVAIDYNGLLYFTGTNINTMVTVTATSANGKTDSCSFLLSYAE